MVRIGRSAAWVGLLTICLTSPCYGFSLIKIVEIFPGAAKKPMAQYVMLQMSAPGQTQVSDHSVTIFDAFGSIAGKFTFAANMANGADQATILLATAQAEQLFNVKADLSIKPVIVAAGGKVCFENVDCVSWGRFSSSDRLPSKSGIAFNKGKGLIIGHAIRREFSGGAATTLEDADDTNDSQADFRCAPTASPKNNAGASGSYADPSPCPE